MKSGYRVVVNEIDDHEQRQFLEGLLEVIATIHSTLELDRVLKQILVTLERIIPYDGAAFMRVYPDNTGQMAEISGFDPDYQQQLWQMTWYFDNYPVYQKLIAARKPVIFEITEEHWKFLTPNLQIKSYIGVPIVVDNEVTAIVHLNKYESHFYNETHAARLQAFALQAAIAIRNAQLYQMGQQVAVLEERQRLARDLHDGVSQNLFAAMLIAEAIPRLWQRNSQKSCRF
jgi:GAF domain-containing protein